MKKFFKSKETRIAKLIGDVNNSYISSIQVVITRLINVINDPGSSAMDLCSIIEIDPSLTSSILRLANSAKYGFQRKIYKVQDAIVAIGFNAVKEIAITQKVCELFKSDDTVNGFSRIDLWKNTVAVALMNKFLYVREYGEIGDRAYAAGLLHNIGIIVEDQFQHDAFQSICRQMQADGSDLFDAEMSVFGYDHAELGYRVTDDWNFPDDLVLAIGRHHKPLEDGEEHARFVNTLFVADSYCRKKDIGFSDVKNERNELYIEKLDELTIKDKAIELIFEDVTAEIRSMEADGIL